MAVRNVLIQALVVHLAAAAIWPASTTSSARSVPTTTCSTSSYTSQGPYYSSIEGPSYGGAPYSWVQYIFPTTVGTVYVIVEGTKTESTTVYNTELPNNGTFTLLTRTDTNSAGTVTSTVGNATVTYPHNYTAFDPSLTWTASIATVIDSTFTCCTFNTTMSPTPTSHIPFPTPPGSTDPADPNGSYYSLQGDADEEIFGSAFATSLFGQSLTLSYTGCHYSACNGPLPVSSSPVNTEGPQAGFVLATTSITLSNSASASSSSASSASSSASPGSRSSASSSPTSSASSSSPPPSSSSESSSVPPLSSTTAAGTTSSASTSSSPSSPQPSSTLSTSSGNGSPPASGSPPSSGSQSSQVGGQPPSSASQSSQGVGSPPSSASQSQVSPPNSSSLQQTVPAGSTSIAASPPSSSLTGPQTTAQNTPGMTSATPATTSPYAYTAGAARLMPTFSIVGWLLQWIVRFFN